MRYHTPTQKSPEPAMFYPLVRRLLFTLPPETAHDWSLRLADLAGHEPFRGWVGGAAIEAPVRVMGLTFPNPVGLAAGLDKNADHVTGLGAMGFGFIEVGTVTPRPQPGNPRPRLFRLPQARAIINRMGFNNAGVDHFVEQVRRARYPGVLGLNIGKNFDTPMERAVDDYLYCLERVYPHADYVTVNISSPNTVGLRDLQQGAALDGLLERLKARQAELAEAHGRYVPLVIKVAPDLEDAEIDDMAAAFLRQDVDGVIATNTTITREGVEGLAHAEEQGGLSGAPVRARSTAVLRRFAGVFAGRIPLIAAGGIMSGEDAVEKIEAGARLVQVYTGFIYRGPALVREINETLRARGLPGSHEPG